MNTQKKRPVRNLVTGLIVLLLALAIGLQVLVHVNPWLRLVGSWQGDGSLDLLGDSPFDGALELSFSPDRTGTVATALGESEFTYDLYDRKHRDRYTLTMDIDEDLGYGQRVVIDRKTLQIERDEKFVSFTRK